MSEWLAALRRLQDDGESSVLVTVAGTRGSTPRELGAKMVVTATHTTGSIGGGRLEYQCIHEASKWLRNSVSADDAHSGRSLLRHFALGANCGQCCGGVADVLFEEIVPSHARWITYLAELDDQGIAATLVTPRQSQRGVSKCIVTSDTVRWFGAHYAVSKSIICAARRALRAPCAGLAADGPATMLLEPVAPCAFNIFIFGAGHVGTACASILSTLETRIYLVDGRRGFVDGNWPDNVSPVLATDPSRIVDSAQADAHFLIMTHDHDLDLAICAAVLKRGEFASCGLIGSMAKRRRFEKRLRAAGVTAPQLRRLTCPIGIESIHGKRPAQIAVAVAAQLQALHESACAAEQQGTAERDYGHVSR